MNAPSFLRQLCLILAASAIVAGGLGMVASFFYFASRSMADITARALGFVASAVLIGAGLLSLTMLATRPAVAEPKHPSHHELA